MARRGSGIRLAALKAAQEAMRAEQVAQREQLRIKTEAVATVLDARAQASHVRAKGEVTIGRIREETERDAAVFDDKARVALHVLRGLAATNAEVAALVGLTAKEVREALSAPGASETDARKPTRSSDETEVSEQVKASA
ncbi:MAG TPA: hypothetical protein VL551_11660 [Actinospica sp.]|jgi:hypothetical protein|nr:hypothetical protein [Actinospica sp.]